MKRNQLAAGLLAALLFVSGVAVGALGHLYYTKSTVSAKTTAEDFRQHYISEMRSKLNLTATQVNQLEGILDETKAKVKAVRDAYHPQMLQIKAEQINQVKSILTPAQIPAYEQLVAERERRAKELEERDAANHHHPHAE
jgi:hypothetical protein